MIAFHKDLSYQQIADALQLPINTVKTNIRQAKKRLKKELER